MLVKRLPLHHVIKGRGGFLILLPALTCHDYGVHGNQKQHSGRDCGIVRLWDRGLWDCGIVGGGGGEGFGTQTCVINTISIYLQYLQYDEWRTITPALPH